MISRRFFDPLYGRIEFTPQEMALILSPEVQRLRYVRMCNINSLLISGASEVSRFEHVVGVMHLAKEWVKSSDLRGEEADVFIAAALLHDVQSGPFGHSMEYILADNSISGDFRHEDIKHGSANNYFQSAAVNISFAGCEFGAREQLGRLWERVVMTIRGGGHNGQLIAGRVDLDNIDNVVRLAYHVGLVDKRDSVLALGLAHDVRLAEGELTVSGRGLSYLTRWQEIRRDLYRLLLHDPAEFSAKAMLTSMIERGVEHGILGADSWLLTDDELLRTLVTKSVGEAQEIGDLGRRLLRGDLYPPIVLWRTNSTDAYGRLAGVSAKRTIERRLSDMVGGRFIVHVILDQGKTERALRVVLRETQESRMVGQDTNEVLIGLFASRKRDEDGGRQASDAFRSILAEFEVSALEPLPDPVGSTSDAPAESAQLELL